MDLEDKNCSECSRRKWYQKGYSDGQKESFNMKMVLKQIDDYGKYKGILRLEDDKCENYIPVSVAKQIVKARGLGGVLGYMDDNKNEVNDATKEFQDELGISKDFIEECKRVAEKYKRK